MARRFVNKKTHRFHFLNDAGEKQSYVLIFGDEVNTRREPAPSGAGYQRIECRGRMGEWKPPPLAAERALERYFLDVGQGDAAFILDSEQHKDSR